jgi:hypothetical protein
MNVDHDVHADTETVCALDGANARRQPRGKRYAHSRELEAAAGLFKAKGPGFQADPKSELERPESLQKGAIARNRLNCIQAMRPNLAGPDLSVLSPLDGQPDGTASL